MPTTTAASVRDASVVAVGTQREMKLFGVFETELKSIALFNSASTGFFSVGTGLLFLVGDKAIDLFLSWEVMTKEAKSLNLKTMAVLSVLSFLVFAVAGGLYRLKKATFDEIVTASKSATSRPS